MIKQELDRIKERISNKDFLENKGLSNEVGIHVFCYKAEDELIVQDYIRRLKSEVNTPYRIIECDLYEVFLSLLEDKRILKSVAGLEEKRGKKYLLDQLQKIATPEALLAKMDYSPHIKGQDVLFMTGIGKIHPFMRSHKMLDSMQHLFEDIPIVMFYVEVSNAELKLLSESRKVSNLLFSLDFYQRQPVGEKIQPCTYYIYMTDDEGVVISDRQTVIADRTSINASERVFRVRLNLKAGAYDKNKIYRLVIANDTDVPEEAEFHIDIAFADDFGFDL